MFNNQDEFLEKLEEAPNPKETKEGILADLQESKKTILDFRERLGNTLKNRAVYPDIKDPKFYQKITESAMEPLVHLETITDKLAAITEEFSDNSKKLQEVASLFKGEKWI